MFKMEVGTSQPHRQTESAAGVTLTEANPDALPLKAALST